MTQIRTCRGRWSPLAPCFPWPIETEYKKYPSLLNFVLDDSLTSPTKLLLIKKHIDKAKIIVAVKYLLKTYPRYKNYLYEAPDFQFVNPTSPSFTKDYNDVIQDAKNSIKKFRIKGKEVLERKNKFEMIGAQIVGDEAVFQYDAREQIQKSVYGIDSEQKLTALNIIGKMISNYIYLFDKIPDFLISQDDENPSLYYMLVKTQPEQIAKILCSVPIDKLKPVTNLYDLLIRLNDKIGSLWPYIVFPSELHPGIKKTDGIKELQNKINYHFEYLTPFKNHIQVCLDMLNYCFSPHEADLLQKEIYEDRTDSGDESVSIETLEIDLDNDDTNPNEFVDKWVINGKEDELSSLSEMAEEEPVVAGVTGVLEPVVEPVMEIPPVLIPIVPQPIPQPIIQQPLPQPIIQQTPVPQPIPIPQPIVQQTPVPQPSPQPLPTPQLIVQQAPPIPPQLVAPPIPAPPPIPWEKRFSKLTQIGHVIEPTNPLSPFGKNQIIWKGEKYENMCSVLYNEAIVDILGSETLFKNSATKAKNHLQAYNKSEHVVIWFKDKGVDILKEMVTSPLYKQRKEQMSMTNQQLCFLYSRRKIENPLLEPWIGVIKLENGGIPYLKMYVGGWNVCWQLQNEK